MHTTTDAPERTSPGSPGRSRSVVGALAILCVAFGPSGAAVAHASSGVVVTDPLEVDAGDDPGDLDSRSTPSPSATDSGAVSAPTNAPTDDSEPDPTETIDSSSSQSGEGAAPDPTPVASAATTAPAAASVEPSQPPAGADFSSEDPPAADAAAPTVTEVRASTATEPTARPTATPSSAVSDAAPGIGSSFLRDIGIDSILPLGALLAITIGGLSAGLLLSGRGRRSEDETRDDDVHPGTWSLSADQETAAPQDPQGRGEVPPFVGPERPLAAYSPARARHRHRLTSV